MISNSTPIICLSKIGRLELLKKLFNQIIIPEAVKEEVLVEDKPGSLIVKDAIKAGWIRVINPSKNIDLGLGDGENAAINLARETNNTLIIDDAFAIKAAKAFSIDFIRTTTVVVVAIQKGIIGKKEAIALINSLIDAGYYISPKHLSAIITRLSSK